MNNYKIPSMKEIRSQWHGSERFKVVSLFAGGGGSSTGYRMAGGKVLAISEFIEEAQKTYAQNWPSTHIFRQDVRNLNGGDILDKLGISPRELDILDGSPPCSAFSTAGAREKGWGKEKSYSDSKQKSVENLFFEYIRVLGEIKPKVMVAENVSGLVKGKSKGYFNEIMRGLRASGYHVECKVLDAKWLGVPQTRNRTIFVGVRDDLYKPTMSLHPKPFGPAIRLGQAIKGVDIEVPCIKKYAIYKELIKLKEGGQSDKYFSLIKCSRMKPAPCITATTGNIGAASPMHWDDRAFSVAEVKRIMSVPDDYVLTGTYSQKVERLGRMVPPLMMKAVAENIFNEVLNGNS